MPVIVVGADTPLGSQVTARLFDPEREVRVFVSDPDSAEHYRRLGAKVALGDVSDDSHVAGAALNCHSAVLVEEAARDERTRSFAADPESVMTSWKRAVESAGVKRVLWLARSPVPPTDAPEVAVVDPGGTEAVEEIYRLDAAREI